MFIFNSKIKAAPPPVGTECTISTKSVNSFYVQENLTDVVSDSSGKKWSFSAWVRRVAWESDSVLWATSQTLEGTVFRSLVSVLASGAIEYRGQTALEVVSTQLQTAAGAFPEDYEWHHVFVKVHIAAIPEVTNYMYVAVDGVQKATTVYATVDLDNDHMLFPVSDRDHAYAQYVNVANNWDALYGGCFRMTQIMAVDNLLLDVDDVIVMPPNLAAKTYVGEFGARGFCLNFNDAVVLQAVQNTSGTDIDWQGPLGPDETLDGVANYDEDIYQNRFAVFDVQGGLYDDAVDKGGMGLNYVGADIAGGVLLPMDFDLFLGGAQRYYWEWYFVLATNLGVPGVGVVNSDASEWHVYLTSGDIYRRYYTGLIYVEETVAFGDPYSFVAETAGATCAAGINIDAPLAEKVEFYKAGVLQGESPPSTYYLRNGRAVSDVWYPCAFILTSTNKVRVNVGQQDWKFVGAPLLRVALNHDA